MGRKAATKECWREVDRTRGNSDCLLLNDARRVIAPFATRTGDGRWSMLMSFLVPLLVSVARRR